RPERPARRLAGPEPRYPGGHPMTQRKRRPVGRGGPAATAAAIEAFKAGDCAALHRALGLRPWQFPCPLGVADDEPCPYPKGTSGAEWWPELLALRQALKQAARSGG